MVVKDSVTIDFNGAVLIGSSGTVTPDQFVGNAIFVKNAQKVTIKNGTIKGYKLGLQGNMARTLSVSDVDFSYNYRERLLSTADFESERIPSTMRIMTITNGAIKALVCTSTIVIMRRSPGAPLPMVRMDSCWT